MTRSKKHQRRRFKKHIGKGRGRWEGWSSKESVRVLGELEYREAEGAYDDALLLAGPPFPSHASEHSARMKVKSNYAELSEAKVLMTVLRTISANVSRSQEERPDSNVKQPVKFTQNTLKVAMMRRKVLHRTKMSTMNWDKSGRIRAQRWKSKDTTPPEPISRRLAGLFFK
ncbi:hypothetical protein K488DRAFT_72337 [Vararia minispora EC-137]|uniref:Uncharacterized protein n=1 Tax=Vararia minispora EC-137 TaxID=1314806 RepID=A0ACB8QF36_9AGAM|nr:hypothetical protein K488DRAFT_72337 [Vararia minispora EC-137]